VVGHQVFDGKQRLTGTGGLYIIDPSGKKLGRHRQRRLRGRRLENSVLLYAHEPWYVQGQDSRRAAVTEKRCRAQLLYCAVCADRFTGE
jgi:hypothetical protein